MHGAMARERGDGQKRDKIGIFGVGVLASWGGGSRVFLRGENADGAVVGEGGEDPVVSGIDDEGTMPKETTSHVLDTWTKLVWDNILRLETFQAPWR